MKSSITRNLLLWILLLCASSAMAQNGIVKGRVLNEINNEPLEFATVFLQGTQKAAYTDSVGYFELTGIEPGLYNLEVRYNGFKNEILYELQVTNSKPYQVDVLMKEEGIATDSVVITASPFKKTIEAPTSLRTIGTNEIARNPGGNRDISRVIQSLPGVGSTVSFRNDILIRGGSPNENRFYLDEVEVPNINHFATQGASGGPVGLINVDFIREVDFYSGAFPANRGNALSSVFEFRQRDGRDDRFGFRSTLGSSDLALTVEGPIGDKVTYLASARRSYLQLLFKALALPFLPAYNDFQFKTKIKINDRNELKIIGLGAIDDFALNLEADTTEEQKFLLGNLPVQTQWNYTIGTVYKHFGDNGYWTFVLSRNMINYNANKYENNDETQDLILDYNSQESENKFRMEYTTRRSGYKINTGVNAEHVRYTNSTFNRLPFTTIDFSSKFHAVKYGAFASVGKSFLKDERLSVGLGLRLDGNSFSSEMANPFSQISPRLSLSYAITPLLSFNFNTGIYYQLPAYTVMGYRDENNVLVNRENGLKYINNKQVVAGLSYTTESNSKIAVEGFFKQYDNYPFLIRDSISLANLGGDFGVIGNEPAVSTSQGRAYGGELLLQQRLFKGFYGILAYTLVWSEFQDQNGAYIPSSWDSRHIISLTAGKKFKRNWEIGAKWRFTSGLPFTPADVETSSLISVWDVRGAALPDYSRLNSERTQSYHQIDIRVDKKWFFKKWSFNLFFDLQNAYFNSIPGPANLTVVRDDNDVPLVDPNDPTRYQTKFLDNEIGIFQPTIGIVVEY